MRGEDIRVKYVSKVTAMSKPSNFRGFSNGVVLYVSYIFTHQYGSQRALLAK